MAAVSNVIAFGHETPAVVAQEHRVFPKGQPISHYQGHAAMLMCLGNVEETLVPVTGSRVGSFMSSQDGKWRVFTSWCSDHQLDPVNCPVGTLLEFLQERLTTGLAPSTLKVYVVARHKWICLRLEGRLTVHSGSPSRIQLHSDWTRWCRHGRGFICMHFPRSLCSRESWREFAGTGFYYFSLPHGGWAENGSQI